MARVHTLVAGHCSHPACMALKGASLRPQCFPARAYLIETSAGPVLWDTGYSSHFMDASSKGVYRFYPAVTPITFEPAQSVAAQLKERGLASKDVPLVLLSHFHADHMAGLKDFPNAAIMCNGTGWEQVGKLSGMRAIMQAFLPGLVPHDMEARVRHMESAPAKALPESLRPFDVGWDVLGTGEVFVVPLPGHADGHVGAFVACDDGWTLLAADAAWAPEAYREMRGPSELTFIVQKSRRDYYATLARLHALHRARGAAILLTHEL